MSLLLHDQNPIALDFFGVVALALGLQQGQDGVEMGHVRHFGGAQVLHALDQIALGIDTECLEGGWIDITVTGQVGLDLGVAGVGPSVEGLLLSLVPSSLLDDVEIGGEVGFPFLEKGLCFGSGDCAARES